MTTDGDVFAICNGRALPPRISTSSSLTIFTTCCAGFSACATSAPRARSLTAAMNSRTTGNATSASSSAMRISRAVASMSASVSRPLPRSDLKTDSSRSESVSNMSAASLRCRGQLPRGLDLDAPTGVHLVDLVAVRRENAAALELHRRRQHVAVRQPFLTEQDEPAHVLHPREAFVDLGDRAADLLLDLGIRGQLGERPAGEPHGGGVGVDRQQGDEIGLVVPHRHRLADERHCLQRRLDVGRRDVLAAGRDDELLLPVDDAQVAVLVELTDVAGVQPAVLVERLTGAFRVVEIALEHDRSAAQYFAVRCGDDLRLRKGPADATRLHQVWLPGHAAGVLAHAVDLAHLEADVAKEVDDLHRYRRSAAERHAARVEPDGRSQRTERHLVDELPRRG